MSRWFSHGQPRLEILWESAAIKDLAAKRPHLHRKAAPNEPFDCNTKRLGAKPTDL